MLKKIEKLIPAALDAIDKNLAQHDDYKGKGIPSGYQSAISGFGTSILQMGLVPTLAVYLDEDSKAEIKRKVLLKTLIAILLSEESKLSTPGKDVIQKHEKAKEFLEAISENNDVKSELKTKLMDAALACKLAIRTFNLVKS